MICANLLIWEFVCEKWLVWGCVVFNGFLWYLYGNIVVFLVFPCFFCCCFYCCFFVWLLFVISCFLQFNPKYKIHALLFICCLRKGIHFWKKLFRHKYQTTIDLFTSTVQFSWKSTVASLCLLLWESCTHWKDCQNLLSFEQCQQFCQFQIVTNMFFISKCCFITNILIFWWKTNTHIAIFHKLQLNRQPFVSCNN